MSTELRKAMTQSKLVIHRSKMKMILLFAGAAAFVALSAFMAQVTYSEQGAGALGVFVGIIGVVFFGFCAVAILIKVFDRRPAIEFSEEGLLARDISAVPIRWQDVLAARLISYRNQPIIELILSPEAEQSLPLTRTIRYTRTANRGLGFEGLCLSGAGLERPAADVVGLIGIWAEKAQAAKDPH